ncbi:MAG: restriction endonuclease subunit S [Alphaproteobacteria bacterium]|nr:restriction endonuclease subunit S [Alphaproteobacteria bacterium]
MIADLKPYPEYKPTDQVWIGDVPAHWKVLPNRALFAEVKDRDNVDEEMLSVTIKRGIVQQRALLASGSKKDSSNLDKSAYKLVRPHDIAYNKMRAWQGAIGASDLRGIISPAYVVMRLREDYNLSRYFHHLYRTPQFAKEAERWSYGITSDMWSLRPEHFKMIYTPEPPPTEQFAINRFLDWANGRFERAIKAKRKMIALLNEQKQSIIHRAVTQGLDPNVPLKPSGIPWLGDIPAHWKISRVKNEFRCLNTQRVPLNAVERGAMTSRIYDYYGASGIIDKVDAFLFNDDLLLIAEDGANLVLRNLPLAIIARGKFWVNNHAHILKPKRGSLVYLAHLLETLSYNPWISGAAQPKLTQDRLMSISIAVAPPEEQDAIVAYTTEQTRPLITAITRLEHEIELLREYRTRLVADVVTGKLDVREVARNLPDLQKDEIFLESEGDIMSELEEA